MVETSYDTELRTQGESEITMYHKYLATADYTNILEAKLPELRRAKNELVQLTKKAAKDLNKPTYSRKLMRRVNSSYICPACKFIVKGNTNMANHIASNCKHSGKHQEWIESQGIDYTESKSHRGKLCNGTYQRLIDIIEKECKLSDCFPCKLKSKSINFQHDILSFLVID